MRPPSGFHGVFRDDEAARALYSEGAGPFRIVPAAVALPHSVKDLAVLAAWATETGVPLTARGAGSGMPGGNLGPGVIVDLAAFTRPLRVGLDGTATVGAAVAWQELNDTAGHFGFRLPPDPSSGRFCTLGGMVATNAAGALSLRHGSIRRWVRGVELVSADGEVFWLHRAATPPARPGTPRLHGERPRVLERLDAADVRPSAAGFPATSKNTAGYALDAWAESGDLLDVVIGSEGTLGFITRVECTLAQVPETTATAVLGIRRLDDLADAVARVRAHDAVAIELLDRTFLEAADTGLPLDGVSAVLVLAFEGTPAEVDAASRAVLLDVPAVFARRGLDPAARAQLWDLRHAASPALARRPGAERSLQVIEDGCVPLAALGAYLAGVRAAAGSVGIPIVAFGHAGDGHLHVNALADLEEPGVPARLDRLREEVTALVIALGGTPSGEHGDGRLRAGALERVYGSETVARFRRLKQAFDPAGVLNPGVILPAGPNGRPPFKGGTEAPAIPAAIAERLRRREREADWGTPPLSLLEEEA